MAKVHGIQSSQALTAEAADSVARLMKVLSTASRVRLVGRLRVGPCTVGDLAEAVEMAQPAVSHQLRILRDLGLVTGRRTGHHVVYELHDPHVATLLDEALRHLDHVSPNGRQARTRARPGRSDDRSKP